MLCIETNRQRQEEQEASCNDTQLITVRLMSHPFNGFNEPSRTLSDVQAKQFEQILTY